MNDTIHNLAQLYTCQRLQKEAGFFRDWYRNTAGGLYELVGRPIHNIYSQTKRGITNWFDEQDKDAKSWWKRNIWDSDPLEFSRLERWLAGDAYTDAARGAPVYEKGRDGRYYMRQRTVRDNYEYNKKPISLSTKVRTRDGVMTLAQQRAHERFKEQKRIIQKRMNDAYHKMVADGHTDSEIANAQYRMHTNYWRDIDAQRRAKLDNKYSIN